MTLFNDYSSQPFNDIADNLLTTTTGFISSFHYVLTLYRKCGRNGSISVVPGCVTAQVTQTYAPICKVMHDRLSLVPQQTNKTFIKGSPPNFNISCSSFSSADY